VIPATDDVTTTWPPVARWRMPGTVALTVLTTPSRLTAITTFQPWKAGPGPAGAQRDWNRLRSLFAPDGRMAAVAARPAGGFGARTMTVDDYVARVTKPFSEAGFFETELARTTETFGQVAHVFSTYEARREPGAKPFQRGINSIQLYHDGARWWITSLLWRGEDDKLALPARYLESR